MLNRILDWTRRNTRRAAALAIAPGLLFLATDAWMEHFLENDGDKPLQWAPILFGIAAAVLLSIVALVRSRAAFAWIARIVGGLGVVVGLVGTAVHLIPLFEDMDGTYDFATFQGSLSMAPPLFAPLAFAGIGSLVFLLASPKLLIRLNVGRSSKRAARVVPMETRRAG
jgi:hypothetical protein